MKKDVTKYFKTYKEANSILKTLKKEFPESRIVEYQKGFTVQFYLSGPYYPDFPPKGKIRYRNPALAIFNPPRRKKNVDTRGLFPGAKVVPLAEFSYSIKPVDPELSGGKWDWLVSVTRNSDGKTLSEFVSGGMSIADSYVKKLQAKLSRKKNPVLGVFNPPKGKGKDLKDYREYIQSLPYKEQMKKIEEAPAWLKEYLRGVVRETMRKGNPRKERFGKVSDSVGKDDFYDAHGKAKYQYLGMAERVPIHVKRAKEFLAWKDYFNASQHAKMVIQLAGHGYVGKKNYDSMVEVLKQIPGSGYGKNPVKKYGSRARFKHERLRSPKGLHHLRTVTVGGHRIVIGCPVPTHKGRCPVGTVAQAILHPKVEKNSPHEKQGKVFSENVEKIYYKHLEDGKYYKHKFKQGVCMKAQEDGSILIYHPSKSLWNNY